MALRMSGFNGMMVAFGLAALASLAGAPAARGESIEWRDGATASSLLDLVADATPADAPAEPTRLAPAADGAAAIAAELGIVEDGPGALDLNPVVPEAAPAHAANAPAEAFPGAIALLGAGVLASISVARKKRAISLVA